MASAEVGYSPTLILWNLTEGKRVASVVPHVTSIVSIAFSPDGASLVTAGGDSQHRTQIIVWDIQMLISERQGLAAPSPSALDSAWASRAIVMAKQLSDFSISRICFSPFEEGALVSCGRENIRFWRIKKGHVPGRPVVLNQFSRGFHFHHIAFTDEPALTPKSARRPCAFFSSNRGSVLKVDCVKEQLLSSYQLHQGPITAFSIHAAGYAVTGGGDSRLRVWPLDFSDFLMEAHHEGSVTNVTAARDGKKLTVGTTAGTLGILDVTQHR